MNLYVIASDRRERSNLSWIASSSLSLLLAMTVLFVSQIANAENYPAFAVIELFTSEGCSSCPPADDVAIELRQRAQKERLPVYILDFHVDYWNYLGWTDRFSKPEYSQRQRYYASKNHQSGVYTPQAIVNGGKDFIASRQSLLDQAVAESLKQPAKGAIQLQITEEDGEWILSYELFNVTAEDVLQIAVVEDHLQSNVARGENAGRILPHVNVVRLFQSVFDPEASGRVSLAIEPDWKKENLSVIAFLQNSKDFSHSAARAIQFP